MDAGYNTIDLERLSLASGGGRRLDLEMTLDDLDQAGQRYAVSGQPVQVRLDVSRTATGYALRLRFAAHLSGPCMRCLADAEVAADVDAREVDQPPSEDEDLRSPYVDEQELDLGSWAHDALVLALPAQVLCRPDCRGLCPVCGATLNDADPADHVHEDPGDPRWAKLRELKLE